MDDQICQRCGETVELSQDDYELLERMHLDCFHFAFEHDLNKPGISDDEDCGDPVCPVAP